MKEYTYNIINDVYNWMISKKKNIEVRILKEKSEAIKIGDYITFNNQDKIGKYVKVKVINKTIVKNIEELVNTFDVERMMPGHTEEDLIELINKIYGDELKYKQLVAFEFEFLSSDLDIQIIEYTDNYLEDVKDLLVELEEYIISIDKDKLDILHKDYREKMAIKDLEELKKNNGKCYLAINGEQAVGLIMGMVRKYEEYDYLDYKCPKSGVINELIVTKKIQNNAIGKKLMCKMEEYFKSIGCEYVFVDVFEYNEKGINFYDKNGYHSRMQIKLKKI